MVFDLSADRSAFYLSRTDVNEPLSGFARYGFFLDDAEWPSVEHYFQALKSDDPVWRERIRAAAHPRQARRLGRSRRLHLRNDWKQVRRVVMTRAVYIKCRTHDEVAERLLATADAPVIETNAYDYFWGCGRDRRGLNTYGQVLMDVRTRLRDERNSTAPS